jgi:hypothetical protein
MIKVVRAVLKLLETKLRGAGVAGPNSRERVREKVVVVLNGKRVRQ